MNKELNMEIRENHNEIMIKKASGKMEAFNLGKLKASLERAGAGVDSIDIIIQDIESWVQDGVSTRELYDRAFKTLKRISTSGALLYRLKQAIISMGPSGFPFEHFIGELFKRQGYRVEVGVVVEGASVSHEMDVIATKANEQILAECKYSVKQGHSVSIQVPLYVNSRVIDIVEKLHEDSRNQDTKYSAWIVTNGRFSPDSVKYSKCKGINLLGWDYPAGNALKDLIERQKMYPITILGSITVNEKKELMRRGIVTCDLLHDQVDQWEDLGLNKRKQASVLRELTALCR